MGIYKALTRNHARTDPESPDPRLRGRVYMHPFDHVWRAALDVAREIPRGAVTAADPARGRIEVEAHSRFWNRVADLEVLISLDPLGRTRVDLASASRTGRGDLGANARRIAFFVRRLDRRLSGRR